MTPHRRCPLCGAELELELIELAADECLACELKAAGLDVPPAAREDATRDLTKRLHKLPEPADA